jgi:hypothetical protein
MRARSCRAKFKKNEGNYMSKIEIPVHVYGAVESELRGRRLRRRTLGGVAMSGVVFAVVFGVTSLRPQSVLALEQVVMKPRPGQVMIVDYTRKMGPVKGTITTSTATDGKVVRFSNVANGSVHQRAELRDHQGFVEMVGFFSEIWPGGTKSVKPMVRDLEHFKKDAWRKQSRTNSIYKGRPVIQFKGSRKYRDRREWVQDSEIIADAKTGNVIRVEDWRDNRSYSDVYEVRFEPRDSTWDKPIVLSTEPLYDIAKIRKQYLRTNLNLKLHSSVIRAVAVDEYGQYLIEYASREPSAPVEVLVGDHKLSVHRYWTSTRAKATRATWNTEGKPPSAAERLPLGLTIRETVSGAEVKIQPEQLIVVSTLGSLDLRSPFWETGP